MFTAINTLTTGKSAVNTRSGEPWHALRSRRISTKDARLSQRKTEVRSFHAFVHSSGNLPELVTTGRYQIDKDLHCLIPDDHEDGHAELFSDCPPIVMANADVRMLPVSGGRWMLDSCSPSKAEHILLVAAKRPFGHIWGESFATGDVNVLKTWMIPGASPSHPPIFYGIIGWNRNGKIGNGGLLILESHSEGTCLVDTFALTSPGLTATMTVEEFEEYLPEVTKGESLKKKK